MKDWNLKQKIDFLMRGRAELNNSIETNIFGTKIIVYVTILNLLLTLTNTIILLSK